MTQPNDKAAGENLRAPRTRRQWMVVCYDIPNDKRRTKVMKAMEGFGHRIQYSVFECELRPADVERMRKTLRNLIDKKADDVRIYPLCAKCVKKAEMLGKAKRHKEIPYMVV